MPRIAIDTREVRSLGRMLEATAQDLTRTTKRVRDRHQTTQLNTEHDHRVGQIKPGVNLVETQLNKTAREYKRLAELATRSANEFEAADQPTPQHGPGNGFWPQLDLPGWFPLPGGLAVPPPFTCNAWKTDPTPRPGWLDWFKDGLRAGTTALDKARGGLNKLVKSATNVGKRFISGARGLLGRATSWADRVQKLISEAWNGIWNDLTNTLAAAISGISFTKPVLRSHTFDFDDLVDYLRGSDDDISWTQILRTVSKFRSYVPFHQGGVGRILSSVLGRSSFGPVRSLGGLLGQAGTSRWLKYGGRALGAVGFGLGAYDLYRQGDPRDAFREDGSEYVADVALTLATGSFAVGFVPGGILLGTVYITAEFWDNPDFTAGRELIAAAASNGWDDFNTGLDFIGDAASGGWNDFNTGLDFIGDAASGGWNDFTTGLDFIGDSASGGWNDFTTGLDFIGDSASGGWNDFTTGLDFIGDVASGNVSFEEVRSTVVGAASGGWNDFTTGLDFIGDSASGGWNDFTTGLDFIGDSASGGWNDFTTGLDFIGDSASGGWNDFTTGLDFIGDSASGGWNDFNTGLDFIGDSASGGWNDFKAGSEIISDTVSDKASDLKSDFDAGVDVIGDSASDGWDDFNAGLGVIGDNIDPRGWLS